MKFFLVELLPRGRGPNKVTQLGLLMTAKRKAKHIRLEIVGCTIEPYGDGDLDAVSFEIREAEGSHLLETDFVRAYSDACAGRGDLT